MGRSFRCGLISGICWAPVAGLLCGLPAAEIFGTATGIALGLLGAAAGGIATGLYYGGSAVLQHYLLRAMLASRGNAPRNIGKFLETMAERLLVYQAGNAYRFISPDLQKYLASTAAER
jgi:hypothetical protein